MIQELKNISQILITEINKIIENIEELLKYESIVDINYQDDPNDSIEKRLQKQETWYDLMFENYLTLGTLSYNIFFRKKMFLKT